jgi:hypothetical protein
VPDDIQASYSRPSQHTKGFFPAETKREGGRRTRTSQRGKLTLGRFPFSIPFEKRSLAKLKLIYGKWLVACTLPSESRRQVFGKFPWGKTGDIFVLRASSKIEKEKI